MGFAVDWVFLPICLWPLALAALVFGLRGRRVNENPYCRKCGFDLSSLPRRKTGAMTCPQCHADLSNRKRIGLGRRVRRRGLVAAALPILVVCTAWFTWVGWYAARTGNWEPYKPAWWLSAEAGGTDGTRRDDALAELTDRVRRGQLSQDQIDAIADKALQFQADRARPWASGWGDVLEGAHDAKTLSDDRWRRYASQAVVMRLEARAEVRRGDPFVLRLSMAPGRVGKGRAFSLAAGFAGDFWLNGHLVHHADVGRFVALGGVCADPAAATTAQPSLTVDCELPAAPRLSDGPQTCKVSFDALVSERVDAVDPPLAEAHVELTAPWMLQPATEPSVKVIHDLRTEQDEQAAMSAECWWLGGEPGQGPIVVHLTSKPLPAGLAGEVVIAPADGTELPAGQFAWTSGWVADWRNPASALLPLTGVDRVNVILRPSAAVAARTVDVTEIMADPIVLPGVPVMRHEPDRDPPPARQPTFPVLPHREDMGY